MRSGTVGHRGQLLAGIFEPARAAVAKRNPLQDMKEGAAFVFHHALLRPVFITQFIFNTASFLILAVFVPYAVRHLGLSASGGHHARHVRRRHGRRCPGGDARDAPTPSAA